MSFSETRYNRIIVVFTIAVVTLAYCYSLGGNVLNVGYNIPKISFFYSNIYELGQKINVEIIYENEFPYDVRVKPPTILHFYGYSENDPENKISGSESLSWVNDELIIEKNSWQEITTISFQPEVAGKYIIGISGFPEISVMVYTSNEVI